MSDLTDAPRKTKTWKDLGLRFVTAIVLLSIAFFPLYFGGALWTGLVALICSRMMWEWVRMSDPKPGILAFSFPIFGIISGAYFCYLNQINWAVVCLLIAATVAGIERARRGGLLWAMLGYLYIAIPCLFIIWLRGADAGFNADGFHKVIFIMAIVFAADVGAYFGGSYFKGPKIAPKLSPNKSWSGAMFGLIAGATTGIIAANIIGFSVVYGIILAFPIVVFSIIGDFLESGLKRVLKVKDSGDLLPGHGGFLDRLDSLMLTVVMAGLALIVTPQIWPA